MRKKFLPLILAIVMALSLAAPVFAAKDDRSDLPEYEILSALPEKLDRPARPTTLEQGDLYSHPAGGATLSSGPMRTRSRRSWSSPTALPPARPPTPRR